jgi:TolB-like protein/Flp pilus assembly protein TadD
MRLWEEVKRRRLSQVAVTYGVAAWAVVQVVTAVKQPLRLPEWLDTAVIVGLIIGFPLALLFCWVFNVRHAAAADDPHGARKRTIEITLVSLFALALVWLLYRDLRNPEPAATASTARHVVTPARLPNSIAVLPFENLSPNPADAYFAVGLHDEILNQLAKFGTLNVIARVSVQGYAGSGKTIPQIGAELNVGAVMEGSIRYDRNHIRVTAQMIDALTGVHLWSETYDRELTDVFEIESDIAMNVAGALKAELSGASLAALQKPQTSSPEAYALYIEARKLYGEDGAGPRIEQLLMQALELDPEFASALGLLAEREAIGLADATSGNSTPPAEREARAQAIRARAERALALDGSVVDAHTALGVLDFGDWRWSAARKRFDAAEKLGSPRDWSADLYSYTGQHDLAVKAARRLAELSPNDWSVHRNLAQTLLRARQYDAAVTSIKRSLEIAPARASTHRLLAQIALARSDHDQAVRETELTERLLGDARTRLALAQLALMYAAIGRVEDARRLEPEIRGSGTEDIGAGNAAMIALAVGDEARALRALEAAAEKVERHEPDAGFLNLMQLKTEPWLNPALSKREFVAVLARIKGD